MSERDESSSDPNINNNDYGGGGGTGDESGSDSGTGGDHHWTGDPHVGAGHGTFSDTDPILLPTVPRNGATGPGGTAVSTPSLDLFAANIDRLIAPMNAVITALDGVSVAPGAFYHANLMRNKVNGPNGDDGLKKDFGDALASLVTGLTDLRDGVRSLSAKYRTTEEANAMTARDFQLAMTDAVGDFNAVVTAAGGTGGTGSTGSTGTGNGNGTGTGGTGEGNGNPRA
ncbi:hypothetical protein [Kitasatospora sp. A2-31]|uniref:hypothetical protein n=3 Tax=Kitasatospora sp. A2-31 TaxID=2916414 RepID=UPI001EEEFAA0|nr:hypothetical protein [Kitasatospora sp. A2-31]MCG6500408.1 hypothetical protein [Kitasatospora sp. A2-31]